MTNTLTELPKHVNDEIKLATARRLAGAFPLISIADQNVAIDVTAQSFRQSINALLASGKARIATRGIAQIEGNDELFFRSIIIDLGE